MKSNQIIVGKDYTNGRGIIRRMIASGPQFKSYATQRDEDCVRYKAIFRAKDAGGPNALNGEYNTTRNSFAKWAIAEA